MPAVLLSCMPTPRASGVQCTLNAVVSSLPLVHQRYSLVSSLPLVHQRYEYRWCTNTPAYCAPTALPLPVVHMPLPVVHMPQYYKLTCPRALCRFSSKQTSQHVPNSSPCCSPNKSTCNARSSPVPTCPSTIWRFLRAASGNGAHCQISKSQYLSSVAMTITSRIRTLGPCRSRTMSCCCLLHKKCRQERNSTVTSAVSMRKIRKEIPGCVQPCTKINHLGHTNATCGVSDLALPCKTVSTLHCRKRAHSVHQCTQVTPCIAICLPN